MDDIMVRVLRTVACVARLRILSLLVAEKERTPSDLADELEIPIALLCNHLRRLSLAGLIQRRPSGGWCYIRGQSPYNKDTFSGKVMAWLRKWLRNPGRLKKYLEPQEAGRASADDMEALVHSTIFEACTGFTHLRRLRILHLLREKGPADGATLTRALKMSAPALCRQMDKLLRRGYVQATCSKRIFRYEVASDFRTPVHAELFEIVCEEWKKSKFRS